MKLCKNLKGGLQEVADQLELRRVGPQHQAGSDSHLTGMAFFKIKEVSTTTLKMCFGFISLNNFKLNFSFLFQNSRFSLMEILRALVAICMG